MGNNLRNIIQITDTHILADKQQEFDGFNTSKSLNAVIEDVNEEEAELVLFSGDLVHEPDEASYNNFLEITQALNKPSYCLPGNHDDPEKMQQYFANTHMQYIDSIELDDWQILLLNSHKHNTHSGYLSAVEIKKLGDNIEQHKDKNILVALHHHAVSINSPWMDGMMLENAKEFNEQLNKYNNVHGVICGHIHQEFEHIENNRIYLGTPSSCIQFKPKATQYERDTLPPAYRRIKLYENGKIESDVVFLNDFIA